MTTGVEEQYEVSLGRAEPAEAPLQPQRHVFARLAHYGGLLRRSMHLRYRLANLLSSLLPDVASGAIRSRLYRWAGFDVDRAAFLMGNLRLGSAAPGFYRKLKIGPGAVVAAGAIVLKDVPPHTYVEGNPAQVIRKLPWAYR